MRIDVLTLFPGMVEPVVAASMLGRARSRGLVDIRVVDLRDYAPGRHRNADDYQFLWIFVFQFFQVRNDVHAVDAAICPEIQQHDFAAKPRQRNRLIGIEPPCAAGKFGRTHSTLKTHIGIQLFPGSMKCRKGRDRTQHKNRDHYGDCPF